MELKKVSNKHDSKEYVSLFVLNDFLKFDRKIYQVFGLQLGRPLSLKFLIYVFVIGGIELIWYFVPVLNRLIIWLPPGVLFAIPFVLAWLLSDVGTEGRSPVTFFKSLIFYHLRSLKRITYTRGKEINKPNQYKFGRYATYGHKDKNFKSKRYNYRGFPTYHGQAVDQ